MATKGEAVKKLKAFSKDCVLIYINDGENTKATLITKSKPWVNGFIGDVDVHFEVGTSKSSFWDDVIDQIENSTVI